MDSFWKPIKPVKKKFISPSIKIYPKRTRQERITISRHPSRDSDKDGVMNWFDCKPLNKRKQEAVQLVTIPPKRTAIPTSQTSPVQPMQPSWIHPKPVLRTVTQQPMVQQPTVAAPPSELSQRALNMEAEAMEEEMEEEEKEDIREARELAKEQAMAMEEERQRKLEEKKLQREIKAEKELEEEEKGIRRIRRKRRILSE